jgi:hypothetical protein
MRILIFLSVVLVTWSCTKEIELDQPHYDSKIVVDGYIEQGRPAYVFLTLSSPFLTHYDSVSIRQSFLNYGKVTLTSSEGEEEVLILFRQDQFFPPFVYRSVDLVGKVGLSYTLTIKVLGQTVRAITSIPEPPDLNELRFSAENDSMGYVEYAVNGGGDEVSHLFTQVRSMKADKDFHPASNPIFSVKPNSHNRVRVWRSRETLKYLSNTEDYFYDSSYHRFQYLDKDSVWLKIGRVDEISHKVLLSMFVDITNQENPFSFNGNRQVTNIEGGIGRWTGIATAPVTWVCGETKPVHHFEASPGE